MKHLLIIIGLTLSWTGWGQVKPVVSLDPVDTIVYNGGAYNLDAVYEETYSAQALALFARMPNTISDIDKANIDSIIRYAVAKGYWARWDALWPSCLADSANSLLNWKSSSFTLIPSSGITFTPYKGFTGKSSVNAYIETGFRPRRNAVNFKKLTGCIGTYMNSNFREDHKFLFGNSQGGDQIAPAIGNFVRTDRMEGKVNEGGTTVAITYMGGKHDGLQVTQKTDSLTTTVYFNGYPQETNTNFPTGISLIDSTLWILANGNGAMTNNSDNRVAINFIGDDFSASEQYDIYGMFYKFLKANNSLYDTWSNDTLVNQGFEGTGYEDNALWTTSGTLDPDYTTTVLAGSQSMYLATGANLYQNLYRHGDATYIKFMYRVEDATPASTSNILYTYNSAAAAVAAVRLNTNGTLLVLNGTTSSSGLTVLQDNTTYYFWIRYIAGTGSNGITDVYCNTSDSRPETAEKSITNGVATTRIARWRPYASGSPTIFDNVLIRRKGW